MQNVTPPPSFLSNVHVLRLSEPEKMVFANVSVCLSVCRFQFVSTITFERIDQLDWPLVHLFSVKKWRSSSLASHFWPMVLVLSIKDGFYKILKSIFRPNNARYEKMLRSKIVHLRKIYNFDFDHFLIKRTVFGLTVKNVIKNQKFNFPDKLCDIPNKF